MAGLFSRIRKQGEDAARPERAAAFAAPIAASELARRVELLDSLEETGVGWFWASDAEGRMIYLSPAALAPFEIGAEELASRTISQVFEEERKEGGKDEGTARPLKFLLAAHNSLGPTPVRVSSRTSRTEPSPAIAARRRTSPAPTMSAASGNARRNTIRSPGSPTATA